MSNSGYNEDRVLHKLKHYLPSQDPLKDFIHHNTLHVFQGERFHEAMHSASEMFGYKTYLHLDEYRQLFNEGRIRHNILARVIRERKKDGHVEFWVEQLLRKNVDLSLDSRIGSVRKEWKNSYRTDLSKMIHPVLFRIVGNYLDQGISISRFPVLDDGFLASIRDLEHNSFSGLFQGQRAKILLLNSESCTIRKLLEYLIRDESLFEQYLFDQQFEHPGWSGMVSVLEDNPGALTDKRNISLRDFIFFELLLEIDALDAKFGETWLPLGAKVERRPHDLFSKIADSELFDLLAIWQEAYEWSYYDMVLTGIQSGPVTGAKQPGKKTFQGVFCMDDRDCSLRRYLEQEDEDCQTFATAGFFNVEFYFQPGGGKSYTKACPAPIVPKYIIKEENTVLKRSKEIHFQKQTHGLIGGWLSQTIGFWSAIKLFFNVFKPSLSPLTSYSFRYMDKSVSLTVENRDREDTIDGLQVGFTIEEMADRIEGLLTSIGLVTDFAPLVYIVGHGASSVNNTHYAGYDCGACAGRPGSVNARVAAHMANHGRVRDLLRNRGIEIPESSWFIGALHDTTRDEIEFFDETVLTTENKKSHERNKETFRKALERNAKERARRFVTINHQKKCTENIHKSVKLRSVSLFEPRPEYNHATNALCIVGRRELSSHLFLDRRAFLNSFDYRVDPEGKYLLNILKAVAPVCGGINLEYYFSRVDNQKLGAGSKLPHNVMGLIGVANGSDGDLRTGLPLQMVEIHDPLRLLVMVEHFPEVILTVLKQDETMHELFKNEWIHLVTIHPETKEIYKYKNGVFMDYRPLIELFKTANSIENMAQKGGGNIDPFVLNKLNL
jgi:uncharacterized protein